MPDGAADSAPAGGEALVSRAAAAGLAKRGLSSSSPAGGERKRVRSGKITKELEEQLVKYVKKRRPRALTREEKFDVLLLQLHLRKDFAARKAKGGALFRGRAPKYAAEVAKILRRSKRVVAETWSEYIADENVSTAAAPANRQSKKTFIPDTRKVLGCLREFMQARRELRQRTVAKDLLDCLIQNKLVYVDRENPKALKAAIRAVQRYIVRKGFKLGRKKGCQHYRMTADNVRLRDEYVTRMMTEASAKNRRIVYMDASYVHQTHRRRDDPLRDPNDEQALQTVAAHNARRYGYIAAIIDADRSVATERRTPNDRAHLLTETLDIFEGESTTKNPKATKDYHGMFNFSYFKLWVEKLLDALERRGVKNAIIVMDSDKFHNNKPAETPRSSSKKAVMQEACTRYGLPFKPDIDTKSMLWSKLKHYIHREVKPVVVEMAAHKGHEVLFAPPHYSDLQPIERLWAIVEGDVGRQDILSTTFVQGRQCLVRAFEKLQSTSVQGCIDAANGHLKALHAHIRKVESNEDSDSENDDSGASSSQEEEDDEEEHSDEE